MPLRLRILKAFLLVLLITILPRDAVAERRIALLVGNASYQHVDPLANPVNDIEAVSSVLEKAGFDVTIKTDLTRLAFEDALRQFLRSATGADVALFYYSGHGLQVGKDNYLVPVDAALKTADDLEIETTNLQTVIAALQSRAKARLFFLDACRNFPIPDGEFKVGMASLPASGTRGFARINSGVGTLIAYSTAPDTVALDGVSNLSPFSGSFAQRAGQPNREIRQILSDIRRDVIEATKGKQTPWEDSALTDDVFLVRRTNGPVVPAVVSIKISSDFSIPLSIPLPRHPDGEAMTATLDSVPDIGEVDLDGKSVPAGAKLQTDELSRLVYKPGKTEPGHADVVSYTVTDDAGNFARGSVAIVYVPPKEADAAKPADTPEKLAAAPVANPLSALDQSTRNLTIGVGAVSLGLDIRSETGALTVMETPPSGQLVAGQRTLAKGSTLTPEEAREIAFLPAVGSENSPQTLGLTILDALGKPAGQARITLKAEIDRCDLAAGEPLDLQGVATGVLPNDIQKESALAACIEATKANPKVSRFRYQLARAQLASGDIANAQISIRMARAMGHVRASYGMGYMALVGIGEPKDPAKAVELFKEAALKTDPYGLYSYGRALYWGRGVAADRSTGLILMQRAAELGHTYAMNELGAIYLSKEGGLDAERAFRFYNAGVERGDIYSMNNVAIALRDGTGVTKDLKQAALLFQKATDGGHPFAPNNLARLYLAGDGVPKDPATANVLFREGVKRGDPFAANNLAFGLLAEGTTSARAEAAILYATAAAFDRGTASEEARTKLKAMKRTDKRAAALRLSTQIGSAAPATIDDEGLIAMARQDWNTRKPRLDLF